MKRLILIFLSLFMMFTACAEPKNSGASKMEQKIYITINGITKTATLENNSSVKALLEKLKAGDITISARDYGGFEKVGDLGFSLPSNDKQMTSQSGDIFLYASSSLVFFYGNNSWSYTKIATFDGMTKSEVKEFLQGGKGNVEIVLSIKTDD